MMQNARLKPLQHRAGKGARIGVSLCLCLASAFASAQEMHHHQHGKTDAAPIPVFVASTAKSFDSLMDDAMVIMDDGMRRAPMNGQSEHDFMTMMIPHHQGAVDMAKAMLLYTKDPKVINLALGIITEQQNEIRVMKAWLAQHPDGAGK